MHDGSNDAVCSKAMPLGVYFVRQKVYDRNSSKTQSLASANEDLHYKIFTLYLGADLTCIDEQ
jgi:hypothetical protein